MLWVLGALVLSLAWAAYEYVSCERKGRTSWTNAPLPDAAIADGPYRSTSIEQQLSSAPVLVKVTAFICLFVGPAFALMMLFPALFFARGLLLTASTSQPGGYSDLALMVIRLGDALLARERGSLMRLELTARLLRYAGGFLAAMSVFGYLRDAADTFFTVVFSISMLFLMLSLLLVLVNRKQSSLFGEKAESRAPDVAPLT